MHIPTGPSLRTVIVPAPVSTFEYYNAPADIEPIDDIAEYFSLAATSDTRLGRDVRNEDEMTAPMLLKRLNQPLVLCEVTVSVDFQCEWDQGGLVIFRGGPPGQRPFLRSPQSLVRRHPSMLTENTAGSSTKWARVAFELIYGELNISSVVAGSRGGLDWAATAATPYFHPEQLTESSMPSVRLKLERVESDLWIWFMVPESFPPGSYGPTPEAVSRRWRKVREITNFFDAASSKGGTWVGCYASRPLNIDHAGVEHCDKELFVEFEGLEIL